MEIQGVLYVDPQAARPAGFCEIYGGEVYWPGLWCCRCGGRMHLWELSESYEAAARPLRARLAELRKLLAQEKDPEEIWHLKRRIAELTPMLTEMNELAELTRRYYEPGYHRNEKYTL